MNMFRALTPQAFMRRCRLQVIALIPIEHTVPHIKMPIMGSRNSLTTCTLHKCNNVMVLCKEDPHVTFQVLRIDYCSELQINMNYSRSIGSYNSPMVNPLIMAVCLIQPGSNFPHKYCAGNTLPF